MTAGKRGHRPDALGNIFVETSRWKMAQPRLDELPELGWTPDYCLGLLLLGPSRSGKTSMVKEWSRRMAKGAEATGGKFTTAYVEIPPAGTLKAVAGAVLGAIGDPDPDYGSQFDKTTRAAEAVERLQIDVLMLDEIQRLLDESHKLRADAASWLTGLLNKRVCPILFIGEPYGALVFEKRYLSGRTLGETQIQPYDWNDRADRKEWREILYSLSQHLGMAEDSGLHDLDTALRLHSYSDGLLGEVTRLLETARADVRRRGLPKLTHEALAQAIDRLRIGQVKHLPNPFRIANPVAGGPPATGVLDVARRTSGKEAP